MLLRRLGEEVRHIAWATERIGRSFAAGQQMHETDFRALAAIYEAELRGAPLSPLTLAAHLDLSPGAITYAVDRLTASGHVVREADPRDGRRVVLTIAPHGRDVAGRFFRPLASGHGDALAEYGEEELERALGVLQALTGSLRQFEESMDAERDRVAKRAE